MAAPVTSAREISLAPFTAVRCCLRSPGFLRPARMFSMRNGLPVTSESASAVRRICPPPSPNDPSIVIMRLHQEFVLAPLRVYGSLRETGSWRRFRAKALRLAKTARLYFRLERLPRLPPAPSVPFNDASGHKLY